MAAAGAAAAAKYFGVNCHGPKTPQPRQTANDCIQSVQTFTPNHPARHGTGCRLRFAVERAIARPRASQTQPLLWRGFHYPQRGRHPTPHPPVGPSRPRYAHSQPVGYRITRTSSLTGRQHKFWGAGTTGDRGASGQQMEPAMGTDEYDSTPYGVFEFLDIVYDFGSSKSNTRKFATPKRGQRVSAREDSRFARHQSRVECLPNTVKAMFKYGT
ncbi:hypothetical protein EGW08_020332 [Elysia chlorotica]|uniref:Uncharacterized protein n=1 Tax=Elysia chlorotica TaxID=188477 RepID=A0A3S0Z6S1_ELYCH|nr:hypothetical protein EGW08_020332 [Elysia chlorotica]